jgi:DNA polymerase III subunit chi
VTEVVFYQLGAQPLERVLPQLLEKSLERGWRAAVEVASEERLEALDSHLWTYRDDSFLPHGISRESDALRQPVVIVLGNANLNGADIRFMVDGTAMPENADAYKRIAFLFNGDDRETLAAARDTLGHAREAGFETTYWLMDVRGRWRRDA